MPFSQKLPAFAVALRLVFLLPAIAGSNVRAQNSSTTAELPVTNLLQLVKLLKENEKMVRDVQLEGTVCAASDPSIGVVVLKDATDVELIELGAGQPGLLPGEKIRIEQKKCLLRRRDLGVQMSAAPIADNNGIHVRGFGFGGLPLRTGRHPLTVEWFNQFHDSLLDVDRWPPQSPIVALPASDLSYSVSNGVSGEGQFKPGLQVEYYEGNWERVPDFDLLKPVKTGVTTNFGVSFTSRSEMVGLRFRGFVDVHTNGYYSFATHSSDGSILYIGDPTVTAIIAGTEPVPPATPAIINEAIDTPSDQKWVSVEGRVGSVAAAGKGLELELRSERNSLLVRIADAQGWAPPGLLNSRVRVTGVGCGVFDLSGGLVLGQLSVASAGGIEILEPALTVPSTATTLLKIKQVQSLPIQEAKQRLPVHIQGVVTSKGNIYDGYLTIQDNTRGIFVYAGAISNLVPVCGDFYDIIGHSEAGDFAPVIRADKIVRLGKGNLPEPVRPAWNALINGSMDIQWVEFQGLVTDVKSNILSMLLPGGQIDVQILTPTLPDLDSFKKSVVTIRGVLFASWNASRQVRVGEIRIHNASITTDIPAPANPFNAVLKTPQELLLFDAQASPFRRVKVRGQIVYADQDQIFLMKNGAGLRVLPASDTEVSPGDLVDVVGYPYVGGTAPQLREALLRKTGSAALPAAKKLAEKDLTQNGLDSIRVQVEGRLLGWHIEGGLPVLEMQSGAHLFFARLAANHNDFSLRTGSWLALTGVYVGQGGSFDLLLNSSVDIEVLSQPSWWTLQRLLIVMGILVFGLILALVWIRQLRWLVDQRTAQLGKEIRERELETERSRIARDLHDDLGSSLTEISVLASTGQSEENGGPGSSLTLFQTIANKSRRLIAALDVIVWAVDPEDNSLQSLADYLSAYAGEYLASTNIACRFKVPISFPAVTLEGKVRHELLMTIKETLNNIVRHAEATEVEFGMATTNDKLDIIIADNGRGIQETADREGHGLKNLSARMTELGGRYSAESRAGGGTTVTVSLPLRGPSGK